MKNSIENNLIGCKAADYPSAVPRKEEEAQKEDKVFNDYFQPKIEKSFKAVSDITNNLALEKSLEFCNSMNETEILQAQESLDRMTSKYIDIDVCTPYEQNLAWVLDMQVKSLEYTKDKFQNQQNKDGALRKQFDALKEAFPDSGICAKDIENIITKQEEFTFNLQKALNNEGDKTYEEVWFDYTGKEFSQEKIFEYQNNVSQLQIYQYGMQKAQAFEKSLDSFDSLDGVYGAYCEYFGDEETAKEKLNEVLKEAYGENVYINDKNEVVTKRIKNQLTEDCSNSSTEVTTKALSECTNLLKSSTYGFDLEKYEKQFKADFEEKIGKTIEKLNVDYYNSQKEVYGTADTIQNLIDEYCASQDGFAEKTSKVLQGAGFVCITAGVITTFIPPISAAAAPLVGTGNCLAAGGRFADNAIDLVDGLSSKNGLTKEELKELGKETFKELLATAANVGINKVSNSIGDAVFDMQNFNGIELSLAQRNALAILSEAGSDFTMSLIADLIIEGEVDIKDDAFTTAIGIFTGLSGAQLNCAKTCFDYADSFISYGEIEQMPELFNRTNNDFSDEDYQKMNELLDNIRN